MRKIALVIGDFFRVPRFPRLLIRDRGRLPGDPRGVLRDHGLPAERVRLEGDPAEAARALTERVRGLL